MLTQKVMKNLGRKIMKWLLWNHCDNCGFTKDPLFIVDEFAEGGYVLCEKCIKSMGIR